MVWSANHYNGQWGCQGASGSSAMVTQRRLLQVPINIVAGRSGWSCWLSSARPRDLVDHLCEGVVWTKLSFWSEQLHMKGFTSCPLLVTCRHLISLRNSWLTSAPQACSTTLAQCAGLGTNWSTFHVPSVSLRQLPFSTRACNHYGFACNGETCKQ